MFRPLIAVAALSGVCDARSPAPQDRSPLDVDVSGDVELPDGSLVRSIRFVPELTVPATVRAGRLRFAPGARVVHAVGTAPTNQTLAADLSLLGTATFVNDNPWKHEAHVLRVEGRIAGMDTLVVDGAADGGVDLRGDSAETFRGTIRVDGGMLIARGPGALGPTSTPVTLRGGKLFLPGVALPQSLTVERDATVWTGGPVQLRGRLSIAAGATLTVDTGGGNPGRISGALAGDGALTVRAGGRAQATTPLVLDGTEPTTLRGLVRVERGTLALAKPDGVDALASDLVLGGTRDAAMLRLDASDQIADSAGVVFEGPGPVTLLTQGQRETLGTLAVRTAAVLRCGDGEDVVRFAASAQQTWSGTLIVEGRRHDRDHVVFGDSADALTEEQLARIGFRDLAGQAPGLLRATLRSDGTLAPGTRVWPRSDGAFKTDGPTDRKRRVLYDVDGLASLCGESTPLRNGDTLSFFGDSITWLGGFTGRIERAIAAGAGTSRLDVRVRNRGINGGGVRDLRDGSSGAARVSGRTSADGNAPQAPVADVLGEDQTTVAVILIGINDVNWKGTTDAEFEDALSTLCRSAAAAGARTVLATLMLDGELPDGTNPDDAHIDRLASITRRVAITEGATLVDLRAAVIAWLQSHNRRLRLDGTFDHERTGLLTYDGVHLSDRGNDLVAGMLADGIRRALAQR